MSEIEASHGATVADDAPLLSIRDAVARIDHELQRLWGQDRAHATEAGVARIRRWLREAEAMAEAQAQAVAHAAEHGADLLEAKSRAEELSQTKSHFLACMSHELRTPLHAILTLSQLGVRKGVGLGPEKALLYFRRIEQSGRILAQLVANLLDLSQIEAGRMELVPVPTDMGEITRAVVEEFRFALEEKTVEVELEMAGDLRIEADGQRLHQVLRNLIGNALKFSPSGSRLSLCWVARADEVELSCRDRGPGIPPEDLQRVFERFAQSASRPREAAGTGLGLTIALEIVQGHGGRIWAENHPSRGAVFRVTLPRVFSPVTEAIV
ncbi:MAG: HAMP domain-containing histidine kinase [Planctomycetes bacterium]|nr:HAMP domain-containing histidine kinase [Planctomycetota bacterium]